MLKLLGAHPVSARDEPAVLDVLAADPIASCTVAQRVEDAGLDARRLRGQLWTWGSVSEALAYSGANLIPLLGSRDAMRAFADLALRTQRACSSIVGRAELVLPLWERLQPAWGNAREVRPDQPLLALTGPPDVAGDPQVRRVRIEELDAYFPAAVAMFTEEVGVDPRRADGGVAYRRRIASLIAGGRAFARFDDGQVVFKAEVGSLSQSVGQIQGVWVAPERRGQGLGTAGTAVVASSILDTGRVASLYVNSYNTAARVAYGNIGFEQVATFATVLLD